MTRSKISQTPPTLPISRYQTRFWVEWLVAPETSLYNVSTIYKIKGSLDSNALKKSCFKISLQERLYQAYFNDEGNKYYIGRFIAEDYFFEHNLTGTPDEHLTTLINQPFNLKEGPPIRFHLVHAKNNIKYFIIVGHHIVADANSAVTMVNQIAHYYNKKTNQTSKIKPFSNALSILQAKETQDNIGKARDFWSTFIHDYPLHITFPNQSHTPSLEAAYIDFNLSKKQTTHLFLFAKTHRTTPFIIFSALYGRLVSTYARQQKLLLSYPVNLRPPGFHQTMGCFVNNLPLKLNFTDQELTFSGLVNQLTQQRKQVKPHQWYTLTELLQNLKKQRKSIDQSILNIGITETFLNTTPIALNGVESESINMAWSTQSIYQLELLYDTSQKQQIKCRLAYRQKQMDALMLENFIAQFLALFDRSLAKPEEVLRTQHVLTKKQYEKMTDQKQPAQRNNSKQWTIHAYFESQATRTPNQTAVIFNEQTLTYAVLNKQANQVARWIQKTYQSEKNKPLQADTLIGICMERSIEMIVGILGILKAGAAYVPIDPNAPQARKDFIVEDSKTTLVIDQEMITKALLSKQYNHTNLPIISTADHLAYVIYTSGTTGNPKGVLQTHYTVTHLLDSAQKHFQFSASDVWPLLHPFVFDVSIWEIWGALFYGGQLVITSLETIKDPVKLWALCHDKKVTVLNQTPQAFYQFTKYTLTQNTKLKHLKHVIFAGDALDVKQLMAWQKHYPTQPALINMYGITEIGTHGTYKHLTKLSSEQGNIGKPLSGLTFYILDDHMNPVPMGVIGEIYVGGTSLARGYLNRAELTKSRFIPNPFDQGKTRLYRSGDIAKWLPNGDIEYIGRNDFQVKIRGFRIELEEIQATLSALEGIQQSVVLANTETNHTYLIAYYVSSTPIEDKVLNQHLFYTLPEYMHPRFLIRLKTMPLTENGKLDREALPAPIPIKKKHIAPHTQQQKALCQLWSKILNIDHIGLNDDFFCLGGDSILAIQTCQKMSAYLNISVPVADLFKYKTLENLMAHLDQTKALVHIPKHNKTEVPLSFAQERLWFIEQYEKGTHAYHIPMCVKLNASTDIELFKIALQKVVQRHDILRTYFRKTKTGQYLQTVCSQALKTEIEELPQFQLNKTLKEVIKIPFDLTQEIPIRATLYQTQQETVCFIMVHHIAFDAWSIELFLKELITHLDQKQSLATLPVQYQDFSVWQHQQFETNAHQASLSYWKGTLAEYEPLTLPTDHPRPAQVNYHGKHIYFELDDTITKQLNTFANTQSTTLYTVLLSCFYALLHKYSHQTNIVVGMPITNREHPELKALIGFFVNSIALNLSIDPKKNFKYLVDQVKQQLIQAQHHQHTPFEQVVKALNLPQDPSRHPIYQVMFTMDGIQDQNILDKALNYFTPYDIQKNFEVAKFDLSLFINAQTGSSLSGSFNYASSLFEEQTVIQMVNHFKELISQLIKTPEKSITQSSLLSAKAYEQILNQQYTAGDVTTSAFCIHHRFDEQAEKSPDRIAMIFKDSSMNYNELNQKANHVAHYLLAAYSGQIKANTPIPICMCRDIDMVIAMLAICKAGAAYVPVDISAPKVRQNHILEAINAPVVITKDWVQTALSTKIKSIPLPQSAPTDLACILYTSGTTGQPKGVMISHAAITHRIACMVQYSQISESDRYLFKTNTVFDVSISDIWTHLFVGASIIMTEHCFDIDEIINLTTKYNIKSIHFTPSQYVVISNYIEIKQFDKVYFSGEAMTESIVDTKPKNTQFINYYGPTETGEITVYKPKSTKEAHCIGRVFSGNQYYVLDNYGQPVPDGIAGELCISGPNLAGGYWQKTILTQDKFIPHPFDPKLGALYKTGDLVKRQPNGQLIYLGRQDTQIKLNGHRIELAEIESVLSGLEGVERCLVQLNKKPHPHLMAYYSGADALVEKNIQTQLSTRLPSYIVPSRYLYLTQWPLTRNGKIDRAALPKLDVSSNKESYVAPKTKIQKQLCALWQDYLNVNKVGITDDFFQLGGHSMLAIQMVYQMHMTLSISISASELFTLKTIERITQKSTCTQMFTQIKPFTGELPPLSLPQKQVWQDYLENAPILTRHIPIAVTLKPTTNLEAFKLSFQSIVARYKILRTLYKTGPRRGQIIKQVYTKPITINEITLSDTALKNRLNKTLQKPFNLTSDYPIRITLFHTTTACICLVQTHHIAADGWTMALLHKDFEAFYAFHADQKPLVLTEPSIEYDDFAVWQQNYITKAKLNRRVTFWQKKLKHIKPLSFKTKIPRKNQAVYAKAEVSFKLNQKISTHIQQLAKKHQTTLFAIFLSGFYVLLNQYTKQANLVITTPASNRIHPQLATLVGRVMNRVALPIELDTTKSFNTLVKKVKTLLSQAKRHQDIPFELLMQELKTAKQPYLKACYQAMFVFKDEKVRNKYENNDLFTPYTLPFDGITNQSELVLNITPKEDMFVGQIQYAVEIFDLALIQSLSDDFIALLQTLTQPSCLHRSISTTIRS